MWLLVKFGENAYGTWLLKFYLNVYKCIVDIKKKLMIKTVFFGRKKKKKKNSICSICRINCPHYMITWQ